MRRMGCVVGVTWMACTAACRAPEPSVVETPLPVEAAAPVAPPVPAAPEPLVDEETRPLGRDTLGAVLNRAGLSADAQSGLLSSLRDVLDVRRMRPSDALKLRTVDGALAALTVERVVDGVPQVVRVVRDGTAWKAEREDAQVEVRREQVAGRIQGSLYESMVAMKEGPALINAFVEALGSGVDFYRDVQNGDEFRLIVEKRYVGDRLAGYGAVVAAEYRQQGRVVRAIRADTGEGVPGYFDERGRSTVTAFLRTPMEFTRITSRYGMRFHPVLHRQKAHNGVDYGAPRGTPVWTVGDGKVLSAAYDGACGNRVLVAHANGLVTGYCHLTGFAKGIRTGARVSQRQVLGYVGSTGRATGPHLHFLMKKNGAFVNPQKIESPRKPGLSGDALRRFQETVPGILAELDAIPAA